MASRGKANRKEPVIAAVIPNYNGATIMYERKPILEICLSTLRKTDYKNLKIIIADDLSPDGSKALTEKFKGVDFVVNRPNGGFAKNTNNGIRYALKKYDPDYLLILNNDIIITHPDWLKKLLKVAESSDEIGMVGCKYLYPDGTLGVSHADNGIVIRGRGLGNESTKKFDGITDVDIIGGVVMLIKTEVIRKTGLLDENFFHGSEDADLCLMAQKKGYRVVYDGQVSLIHLEGFSAKFVYNKSNKDNLFPRWQANYIYFALKNFPLHRKIAAFGVAIATAVVGTGNRDKTLANLRFKDRIPWRLYVTFKAMGEGCSRYMDAKRNGFNPPV